MNSKNKLNLYPEINTNELNIHKLYCSLNVMQELIDNEHINQLMETLESTGECSFLETLYDSLNETYSDFLINKESLLCSSDKTETYKKIHLLRNKFRNLGMVSCAKYLNDLKQLIQDETAETKQTKQTFQNLEHEARKAMNLFFESFLT